MRLLNGIYLSLIYYSTPLSDTYTFKRLRFILQSAKSQSDTEAPPAISSPEESVSEKTNVASASGSLSGIVSIHHN